jgi:hypothetical protein
MYVYQNGKACWKTSKKTYRRNVSAPWGYELKNYMQREILFRFQTLEAFRSNGGDETVDMV